MCVGGGAALQERRYGGTAVTNGRGDGGLNLEHLECSHQPHIQGRGAEKRTQRAG